MTERAIDVSVVQSRLSRMRELLDDLEGLGTVDLQRLQRERQVRYMVERVLTLLIDSAVAINAHITAARLGRAPSDYTRSFADAAAAGAIAEDLAVALAPSAGLRNALVHEYLDIDLARVAEAVPLALRDYRRYIEEVARFVLSTGSEEDEKKSGMP